MSRYTPPKAAADAYDNLEAKRRSWLQSVERVEALESKQTETTRKLVKARGEERMRMAELRIAASRARNGVS